MRKFACGMAAVLVGAAAAGLAACAGGGERTRYTIDASYDDGSATLTATMTADVVLPFETDTLKFQLWANAYREGAQFAPVSELFAPSAYYDGVSYGGIAIERVEGYAYEICGQDENILSVSLGAKQGAGSHATVSVTYCITVPKVDHRLGVTRTGVNLAQFYPVLCAAEDGAFKECVYSSNGDPFVSEIADYDVTLTVPARYSLISGFAAEESASDGKRAYHVRADGVRDVAFVLGENYQTVSAKAGDVDVTYAYCTDTDPQRTLDAACCSLTFYSETFGGYGYPAYTVVETGFVYGGMEYPALSMIAAGLSDADTVAVVAHETAHQWWYAMVGSNQYDCAWQDEGLAEFSTALFFGAYPEYGVTYRDFVTLSERSYRAYFSVTSQLEGRADTAMNRALPAYSGDYEYRNVAYDKGVILFDRVRETAGEKKFFKALKAYHGQFTGKIATYDDLVSCFEGAGANVRALFASFVEGKCVI